MRDTKSCIGSQCQGTTRGLPKRVPMNDSRGVSVNPNLLLIAVSLALWVMIIGSCSIVFG